MAIRVTKQREIQSVGIPETCMGFNSIPADSDDPCAGFNKIFICIPERTRLGCTAIRMVFRIKKTAQDMLSDMPVKTECFSVMVGSEKSGAGRLMTEQDMWDCFASETRIGAQCLEFQKKY